MKIRSGFVSNSSSSSFTCNVCGETVSGMDMSRRESGMEKCVHGHTFCESHEIGNIPDPTIDEKRQNLIEKLDHGYSLKYYLEHPKEKVTEIAKYMAMDECSVESHYEDIINDDGKPECNCPICSFKDLDTLQGLKYILKKFSLTENDVLREMEGKFSSYSEFLKYIA